MRLDQVLGLSSGAVDFLIGVTTRFVENRTLSRIPRRVAFRKRSFAQVKRVRRGMLGNPLQKPLAEPVRKAITK